MLGLKINELGVYNKQLLSSWSCKATNNNIHAFISQPKSHDNRFRKIHMIVLRRRIAIFYKVI